MSEGCQEAFFCDGPKLHHSPYAAQACLSMLNWRRSKEVWVFRALSHSPVMAFYMER